MGSWRAQTESELRAEIAGSIVKVKLSGNKSRGIVTRSTFFSHRSTRAHQISRFLLLKFPALFSLICNTAPNYNIGPLKLREISNIAKLSGIFIFLRRILLLIKKEIDPVHNYLSTFDESVLRNGLKKSLTASRKNNQQTNRCRPGVTQLLSPTGKLFIVLNIIIHI